ncbi:MAG: hypothetical protein N2112_09620 [Gemmataceae bacterium]|jgi:hypothetical protein|nr:hypothetical protein [Gemmataceae bacterium]
MAKKPIVCVKNKKHLTSFHDLMEFNRYPFARERTKTDEDWGMGNISQRAVAYSCGHLTLGKQPLNHLHDPDEFALCKQRTDELVQRLQSFTIGEGARLQPFFAVAVLGEPIATEVNEELVRRIFGGTLYPDLLFSLTRLVPHPPQPKKRRTQPQGRWPNPLGLYMNLDDLPDPNADIGTQQIAVWDEFADWFTSLPELTAHTCVGMGYSDADPGPLKPRLLLALTPAGSVVGVIGYEVQA